MSNYWKNALIIGGIYWLISVVLYWCGTMATLSTDAIMSVVMLLLLIPLNWLKPIKWIDKLMNKHPLIATFLASVGWVPYFIGLVFVLTTAAVFISSMIWADKHGAIMYYSMITVNAITALRQFATLLLAMGSIIVALVYGKSIAGQLDDHYNVKKKNENNEVAVAKAEVKDVKAKVKAVEKAIAKKAPAKKTVAKKAPAKKAATKAPATKKTVVKAKVTKPAAKKTVAKKPATKK